MAAPDTAAAFPSSGSRRRTMAARRTWGFLANSIDEVKAFHAKAIELGGKDDGPPGYRPEYTPGYYAAFVRDLDGNKIEAMLMVEGK
jgi:predicted lactoylglutathione lyase